MSSLVVSNSVAARVVERVSALGGTRLPLEERGGSPAARLARAAFAVVLLGVSTWIVRGFLVQDYRSGAGHDFSIFLGAAHAVLDGRSPYPAHPHTFTGDAQYVYPPLLAFLVMPLTAISPGLAVGLFAAVNVAALLLALYLLGVTDWRCYALATLYQPTRDAIGTGTIGPLLLLLVGLAWRFRDRLRPVAGVAVGAAVILKLFLWPIAVWLAITRRYAVAALALASGLVLAVGSWAVIDFRGLGDYPALLSRLSHLETLKSYSAVALGHALGLPTPLAWAAALVLAALLLVAAARAARHPSWSDRDRDAVSLTYALGAALVASPIIWQHYLILMLAPLALARPRLSPLWFVPLIVSAMVYAGWERGGWAQGDLNVLVPPVAVAAIVFTVALRRPRRETQARPSTIEPRF
jgi:Glycosyltransferase family 87